MSRIPMKLTSGERMVSKYTFPVDKITFHRLVDEGTVAKVDKPEEEPVVDCQNTADNYQKKMPQNSQISQNYLLYMVLARAATELRQLSAFWPLYTHSVPTLILGRMKLP